MYDVLKDFAGPVATVIAASAAFFVAWTVGRSQVKIAQQQALTAAQQAELARLRIQHDLFDRRFAVYEAARVLLLDVFEYGNATTQGFRTFAQGTDKAIFIFDQPVVDYLQQLRIEAINLQEAASIGSDIHAPMNNERQQAIRRRAELTKWFNEQFDVLIEMFKSRLALDSGTASADPRRS